MAIKKTATKKWSSLLTSEEERLKKGQSVFKKSEEERLKSELALEEKKQAGWNKGRKNRDELARSNPSYTRDAAREALRLTNVLEEKAKKDKDTASIELFRRAREEYKAGKVFTEKEVNAWRLQYPNAVLTRQYTGSQDLAVRYWGESDNLLYQLKNLMQFRQLGQLKMTRLFVDGTVITAWSIFGQDFVNIDVSRTVSGIAGTDGGAVVNECTVTFINLPISVSPMRYPGEIKTGEIEGIDYIKTYYSYDISRCSTCNDQSEFTFEFTFNEPPGIPFFEGSTLVTPPILPDPENHCVISQDGGCRGEVIEQGSDDSGTYIIWKVYTESQYNRSGLAGALITASIKDKSGTVICSVQQVVMVDCCLRRDISKPEIYWEFDGDVCIGYGGATLCEVPPIISLGLFSFYASGESGWAARYYALPEVGGCPPYEWKIDGPGSLYRSDIWGRMVTYLRPEDGGINGDVTISVTDRCGRYDSFLASCCETAGPLAIEYTSLLMSCNSSQMLTANGGCGPYSWSLSGGGGTIEPVGRSNEFAVYTAPASNANCTSNPIIMLADYCGSSAQLKLAVNCWAGNENSMGWFSKTFCSGWSCTYNEQIFMWTSKSINYFKAWNCDGTLICNQTNDGCGATLIACNPTLQECCANVCLPVVPSPCGGNVPGCCNPCLWDQRTQGMKDGGCCPINPFTGLPY